MEQLEGYLDNIIKRQERLESFVLRVVSGLLLVAISSIFINAVSVQGGGFSSFFTGGASAFIFSILGTGIYIAIRLHACMNGCDLIKIRLAEGGLKAAEEALDNTHCTRDIDTNKLKQLSTLGK